MKKLDFFGTARARRSIRKFKHHIIPIGDLDRILEAAQIAPSAGNRQPWSFILVFDSKMKERLAKASRDQMFLTDASVIVVGLTDPSISERWHEKDLMIAIEHIALAAAALSYGSCWIGAFTEQEVKSLLDIPDSLKVIALLPIVVPDETPKPQTRKRISDIFFRDKYGVPYK